jgi:hypothetical protein
MTARRLGYHELSNRDVFLMDIDSLVRPLPGLTLPSRYFSCLCVMDARSVSVDDVWDFSKHLLRAGCAYFCAWGPDCKRVHDIMDEIIVGDDPPRSSFEDIMTTWHEESLTDALEFFFLWTAPHEAHISGCRSVLVITVGSPVWTQEIADYISGRIQS